MCTLVRRLTVNASSRGHLPIVKYLTTRRSPDPFIRNAHGETAYDVAAATFEIHICDVLASYEAKVWGLRLSSADDDVTPSSPAPSGGSSVSTTADPDVLGSYNPLALHTTVPIVLHENQRLDLRIGSLAGIATKGGRLGFKASALSKNDRRAPFTIPPGFGGVNPTKEHLPVTKVGVGLPKAERPFELVVEEGGPRTEAASSVADGKRAERPARDRTASSSSLRSTRSRRSTTITASSPVLPPVRPTIERSHFWLSEWQTDLTPPSVDPSEGWQYATSFDAPTEAWTAQRPPELERLLEAGSGEVLKDRVGIKWVRRRRWVRVCRRRLDRPPLPFADVDDLDLDETEVGRGTDYLARAKYLAGTHGRLDSDSVSVRSGVTIVAEPTTPGGSVVRDSAAMSKADLRRAMAKLETAVSELKNGLPRAYKFARQRGVARADEGITGDGDAGRKRRAQALLEAYESRFDSLRGQLVDGEGTDSGASFSQIAVGTAD